MPGADVAVLINEVAPPDSLSVEGELSFEQLRLRVLAEAERGLRLETGTSFPG